MCNHLIHFDRPALEDMTAFLQNEAVEHVGTAKCLFLLDRADDAAKTVRLSIDRMIGYLNRSLDRAKTDGRASISAASFLATVVFCECLGGSSHNAAVFQRRLFDLADDARRKDSAILDDILRSVATSAIITHNPASMRRAVEIAGGSAGIELEVLRNLVNGDRAALCASLGTLEDFITSEGIPPWTDTWEYVIWKIASDRWWQSP